MLSRNIDTWIAAAFMLLGIGVYSVASGYDPIPSRFPIILSLCSIVLSVLLFVNTVKNNEKQTSETSEPAQESVLSKFTMPVIVGIAMCAYAASLEFCGFIVPSVLLMLFIAWILGYRRAGVMLLTSLLVVLAVYGIFDQLLGVPLPESSFFAS
ncbi:tripartite tricarboxylate transporter TctB family protein [Maridesulfovibrio bastinii]|uniref:tripartite tricarboxylate transporter TctB family protein n=1 Tax=Maridesulfovibrio bastinii TaxID=47157 RepID=UPI00041F956F|nr:tripartite tricarboxylate transporter TctB family protein [Maridesulfovibrio bastinii]